MVSATGAAKQSAQWPARFAAELGAHVIKVKLPTDFIEQAEAKKAYEQANVPRATLAERVRHAIAPASLGLFFEPAGIRATPEVAT